MHAYRNAHKPCCPRLRSMIRRACPERMHRAGIAHLPPGNGFWESGGLHPLKALAPSETQTETQTETETETEPLCVPPRRRAGAGACRQLRVSSSSRGDPVLLPEEGRGDRPFAVFPRARRLSAHTCRRAGRAVRIPGLACLPTALSPGSRLSEKRMKKPGKSRPPAAKRLTLGGFHAIISATVPGGDGAANREEKGCRFR